VPAKYTGGDLRLNKELEQTHVVLGFAGPSRIDEGYYAAQTLSTLLGGGMSSRLFQEIREKRGLAYSIYSSYSGYIDGGQFVIYTGTGPESVAEVMPVLCNEILKVTEGVTEKEIERAKAQIRTSLLMGRESMMTRADQQAKYLIYRGSEFDINDLIRIVNEVDKTAIQNVARKIFSSTPTLSALGPLKGLEDYGSIVEQLKA
jgi:predicted Zn-dependent peptidase